MDDVTEVLLLFLERGLEVRVSLRLRGRNRGVAILLDEHDFFVVEVTEIAFFVIVRSLGGLLALLALHRTTSFFFGLFFLFFNLFLDELRHFSLLGLSTLTGIVNLLGRGRAFFAFFALLTNVFVQVRLLGGFLFEASSIGKGGVGLFGQSLEHLGRGFAFSEQLTKLGDDKGVSRNRGFSLGSRDGGFDFSEALRERFLFRGERSHLFRKGEGLLGGLDGFLELGFDGLIAHGLGLLKI